jgi:predicted membrane GTPase involved in stress response
MELISEEGMERIEDAIKVLVRMGPNNVETEKIKTIVKRNTDIPERKKSINISDTEASSRKITAELDRILNEGTFEKSEVGIA